MIIKANKQIGFIYKNNESIDKILKDGDVVFERGFLRERTSTTLPITFGGVGKDLKDYKTYGNTYQKTTTGKNKYGILSAEGRSYGNSLPTSVSTNIVIDNYGMNNIEFHIIGNSYYIALLPTFQLNANTEYIITYTRENSIVSGYARRYIYAVDENNNYSLIHALNSGDGGNKTYQFTTPSNGKIAVAFGYSNGSSGNTSKVTNLMVRLATESDDTFEPYTGGQSSPNPDYPQEIVSCGDRTKNLFLASDTPTSTYRATYSKINKNSFSLNYNQENSSNSSSHIRIDFDVSQFKPNTQYTISKKNTTSGVAFNNAGAIRSYINGSNGNVITEDSFTFTTPNEITSLGMYFYLGYSNTIQGESTITFYDVQLEEGSTATSYEPYGYKIPVNVNNVITNIYLDEPLRRIEDYFDYIDFINGKVVRQLGEIILNGSESWGIANGILYRTTTSSLIGSGINVCSTHFIGASSQGSTANVRDNNPNNSICTASSGSARLYIKSSQFDSESSFKTWLQSNNVTVDYVLATPTEESITLPNIPTVDGNNTLNIETEIAPSQVYIKYKSNT